MRAGILLATALAGCATAGGSGDSLADAIGTRTAGPEQDCISTSIASDVRIIDDRTIAYRRVGTIYVNRLPASCPGLRPLATLVSEVYGSQICRNDRIRATYANEVVPGPRCLLGRFTPYRLPEGSAP